MQLSKFLANINIPSSSVMMTMDCGMLPLCTPSSFTNSKSTLKPSSFSIATLSFIISMSMHLVKPALPAGKVTVRGGPLLKSVPSEG